jgi:hypothetical protein
MERTVRVVDVEKHRAPVAVAVLWPGVLRVRGDAFEQRART